jgi:cell division protein FtsX
VSNLIVVPNEVDGWDVLRSDDPQALTNTPTKETAVEAAQKILADEGGGEVVVNERAVHRLDDTSRGVKTYVIALLGLLAAVTVIIVITSLLASATLD